MVDCSYLTEIGKVDIYWTGSRLTQLPPTIPPVGKNISRQAVVPWRYHFNTGIPSSLRDCLDLVTFSYTTVWWTWEDWENMLDWMALHGINLPLAWSLLFSRSFHSISLLSFHSLSVIIPFLTFSFLSRV